MAVIQNSSGGFESRELTLGVKTQGYIQVLKGLKKGERVVTSSTFLIDSESRLKEALSKMGNKSMDMKISGKKSDKMKLHLKEKR